MAGTVALPAREVEWAPANNGLPVGGGGGKGPRLGNYGAWTRWDIMPVPDGLVESEEASGKSLWYQRMFYPNTGGPQNDTQPTQYNPRTSDNQDTGRPLYPIPVGNKLHSPTYRREFNSWQQRFPSDGVQTFHPIPEPPISYGQPPLPEYLRPIIQRRGFWRYKIQRSMEAIFDRRLRQVPQMQNPYFNLLTEQPSGSSYGAMTNVLAGPTQSGGSVFGG